MADRDDDMAHTLEGRSLPMQAASCRLHPVTEACAACYVPFRQQ
jgi:hypothetical protein